MRVHRAKHPIGLEHVAGLVQLHEPVGRRELVVINKSHKGPLGALNRSVAGQRQILLRLDAVLYGHPGALPYCLDDRLGGLLSVIIDDDDGKTNFAVCPQRLQGLQQPLKEA